MSAKWLFWIAVALQVTAPLWLWYYVKRRDRGR